MLVSVIVPVYGVEKFVGRCIESILNQTWSDIEVLVVDDKSRDNSIEVIQEVLSRYPEKSHLVRILHHSENKGLPAARNTGLAEAKGEYVFHFDGDDFAEPGMIEAMAERAMATNADIVYSDWYLYYENSRRYMCQPECQNPKEALTAILEGRMKYNVWNKLVRRSLYTDNNITFPSGYGMGEDMTMIRLIAVARSVKYVPSAFYNYVKTNAGAMTENVSDKSIEQINHNVRETEQFLRQLNIEGIDREIELFKLSVKYPLLFSMDKSQYKLWKQWFPESASFIGDKCFGLRTRLVQWLALHQLHALLKLHFQLHKSVYSLKYRLR